MSAAHLLHYVGWKTALLAQEPVFFNKVIFLVPGDKNDPVLTGYTQQLAGKGYETSIVCDISNLEPLIPSKTIVVHIPQKAESKADISAVVNASCTSLISAAQVILQHVRDRPTENQLPVLFSLITRSSGVDDLAVSPLHGIGRVIKAEMGAAFGGIFDEDKGSFPLSAIQYAQGFDVVKISDGLAQTALLQPIPSVMKDINQLRFVSNGSYLITGGTGGMGIEIATWMVQRGARNIILASRSGLNPASDTGENTSKLGNEGLATRISGMERLGASVHVLAFDISQPGADIGLRDALQKLEAPPVRGLVHAAGVAAYHTLNHCAISEIPDVLAPKVTGTLNLDALFPPKTLDFFVLTSSVGHLFGFPGQLSYGAANAFLDELAIYRRKQGDNAISIQWSCWHGVGMMVQSKAATRMILKGMQTRGFEEISKDEAFAAWDILATLDLGSIAVVRPSEIDADEQPRHPMLREIAPRKSKANFSDYPKNAIAVIGMACRTAAGDNSEDLWRAIREGRTMEREIDEERFPDKSQLKKKLYGNFMPDTQSFDHLFFKKSKREAAALDPHQRVLLETTYHALETAGWLGGGVPQETETHDRSEKRQVTGCFIGMNAPDYSLNLACHPASPYTGFGMLRSFVAGRLSHHFGWTGPSQTIDTACSSAMVAIHQACRAIQAGECTQAVAGGVNLITNTALFEALRVGGFLNNNGACRTFDQRADGYCRGEAVGAIVLKPLEAALADGNDIQGVLLATGNNQNINNTSITNPVLESQVALYKDVLARAGVEPHDVSYVEAHGTGTKADSVEVAGIRHVLGGAQRKKMLHIGAVKPNIGHSEGASGMISLIKVLLMMRHGQITPQAHFQTLNSNIPALEPDHMAISRTLKDWKDDMRLALVNSYGASGNNAAAVVAPPPLRSKAASPAPTTTSHESTSLWPFFVSAASKASLKKYCVNLERQIGDTHTQTAASLAFALATKQNCRLPHVFATTASSLCDLRLQLSDSERDITTISNSKPVVLLFSGQNGNTLPPVRSLFERSVLFRNHMLRCDKVMQSLGLPSLFPVALDGLEGSSDLCLRHAVMFAIQYSCGTAWIDSGVKPHAICGHSFGEWAALTVAGALTLEAGVKLVTGLSKGRAAIIQEFWGEDTGSMIAIEADLVETKTAPSDHLKPFFDQHPTAKLDIACYNGPNTYVVAGSSPDIEVMENYLRNAKANGEKLRYKVLKGMHAYHSVMADSIVEESAALSESISFQKPIYPFESCHRDTWTGPGSNVIASNTRGPVYFMQAIERIVSRLGPCTFLEAGVGGPIVTMVRNALPLSQAQSQYTFVPISIKDPVKALADATVALWKSGQTEVQFWPFHKDERSSYSSFQLPPYQFERHRHWLEYIRVDAATSKRRDTTLAPQPTQIQVCPHCLKDTSVLPYIIQDNTSGSGAVTFRIETQSRRYHDLVKGHIVVGSPISPAAMYLEFVSHALAILRDNGTTDIGYETVVESLKIKAPLGLDPNRSVRLTMKRKTGSSWIFELASTSKDNTQPTSHATGTVSWKARTIHAEGEKLFRASNLLERDTYTDALRGKMVYKMFRKMASYSPIYQGLRHLVGKGHEGAGDIEMPADTLDSAARTPNEAIANPVLLDNFLQVPGIFVHSLRTSDEGEEDGAMSYICTGMGCVGPMDAVQQGKEYRVYTNVCLENSKEVALDLFAFDKGTGRLVWSAQELTFSKVLRKSLAKVLAGANPGTAIQEPSPSLATAFQPDVNQISKISAGSIDSIPIKEKKIKKDPTWILRPVQRILSHSLDVPIEGITRQATLEDLGADSLVNSEILANVCDEFHVDITIGDLSAAVDVESLCSLISSHLDPNIKADKLSESSDGYESQHNSSLQVDEELQELEPAIIDFHKGRSTVFGILSRSLDISVAEIQMNSNLEDLGADSLVAAEIISNLNDALGVDISTTEFASIADVNGLCSLVLGTNKNNSIRDDSSNPSSIAGSPPFSKGSASVPSTSVKSLSKKRNPGWLHDAFQKVRRGFDNHAKRTKFMGYWDEAYQPQRNMVVAFIAEAFEKLGCSLDVPQGQRLHTPTGILSKYQREITRLWDILIEAGIARKDKGFYYRDLVPLQKVTENRQATELSEKLRSDFPRYVLTHSLPGFLGPHLAECLTGKSDPVSLVFGSQKGRELLEDYYANSPDLGAATGVLCDFFSAAIESYYGSDGEPFRILEIGAGTGGTTKHLIPLLKAAGIPFKYTFTELSGSLLVRAKKIFIGVPEMEFLKLNLEDEPPEKLKGRYHIAISSNCVHATRNLRTSLTNIRKMVRPQDGCVALVELTLKLPWYELVWGLLDGWWLFSDGREYALQSPWAWERTMKDVGFAHVDWSESASHESRSVRVICGMMAEPEALCPAKATSILLHRGAPSSGGQTLFLAPDGFGAGAVFNNLQSLMGDVNVCALNSPFLRCKPDLEDPPALEELAAVYLAEIKRRQPEGPYFVGGYSIGGVVAYEIARQLLEDDNTVEKLVLIDAACPTFARSLPDAIVDFFNLNDELGIVNEAEIRERTRGRPIMNDHFVLARRQLPRYKVSKLPGGIQQVILVAARDGIAKGNIPKLSVAPEEQKITQWFLEDRPDGGAFGWDELVGEVVVVRAPGTHFSMMTRAMTEKWAPSLVEVLSGPKT